ncbi:OPT family oligopeptide transporter [Terriglobus aquaticus]|uniref:OPT family oligopeptide transporter n=1 Tax=Terriglobus aquaticus TaxID=940139 RepID=A0ABW9KG53_9BACT|nr:oligopeptide transporter, OPT family [Terriglobus aquaticus]
MATTAVPSPKSATFRPFVPASESRPEMTFRAILIGALFGVLFGAVTVYVGLKAGLTVAASIPISVLSISILRVLGKPSILENNIVQTTGNAGQSIASGVIFTLPALIFLGFDLEYARIFALALFGGWLGVLFMIPLRRQLIVEEHGTLLYPEGTACADVLIAGERGGSFASRVFLGLGLGSLYTLFQNENLFGLWPSTPNYEPNLGEQHLLKGGAIRADATSEYLGVGYIIGLRVAGVLLAGGVFSWLVLMPAIYFFGSHLPGPLYPGTVPIRDMGPSDLWRTYIRPMGAGAVAAAGLLTLLRTLPTIVGALRGSVGKKAAANTEEAVASTVSAPAQPIAADLLGRDGLPGEPGGRAAAVSSADERSGWLGKLPRTAHDLPNSVVFGGSALLVLIMAAFLQFKPVPGAQVGILANLAAALLIVVFGFLFVTVSARIVGIVGSSASPVSGMTIATLMATAAIFLVKGWTAPAFGALAITIGGVVCIAASNAGDCAQDLKTGYLIGATPWKTQLAIMIGVIVSVFSIGVTLKLMNTGLEEFRPMAHAVQLNPSALPEGVHDMGTFPRPHIRLAQKSGTASQEAGEVNDATRFHLVNAIGSPTLEDGKYLMDPATGALEIQWIQGIGSEKAAAPQGRLMATVINGILSRKLPWSLVLLGVALVIAVELLGIRSLTFAVGAYLSIATTLAIFVGGLVRWLADRAIAKARARDAAKLALLTNDEMQAEVTGNEPLTDLDNDEISPGSLFASGLIAAGGLVGLLGVATKLLESVSENRGGNWHLPRFSETNPLYHDPVAVVMFALLAGALYYFARTPLKEK